MKSLICYKTKHGATEKYMHWLADAINAELKTFDEIDRKDNFSDYDVLVVSSGTYAGLMPLNRFLKRHWKNLEDKKVPKEIYILDKIPRNIIGKISKNELKCFYQNTCFLCLSIKGWIQRILKKFIS